MKPDKNTQVQFGDEAIKSLMAGADLVVEATATTLGPRGRNVAIDYEYDHVVLHDGVSVASAVNPKDPYQKLGAKIIKEAAKKQRDEVGDGTTVALILAQAILKECFRVVSAGTDPMMLRRGLEEGSEKIIKALDKKATPVKTLEEKVEIATISSENPELGKLVADTLDDIGDDGVVTVEESKSSETIVEKQEGMQLDHGFVSPYFVTDPLTMTSTLEDARILVTDRNVTNFVDLVEFINKVFIKESRTLFVLAPEIGGNALASFIQNKIQGNLLTLCVTAPGFGSNQKEILQDIAVLTGAKFISSVAGDELKNLTMDDLGRAARISADKETTLIVGGKGEKKLIDERIKTIKLEIEKTDKGFDQEKLRERLGKLSSGVAVIKVGGATEVEMKERKERVIDAVAATRAAVEEGIIAGGEVAFLDARTILDDSVAEQILYRALEKPFVRLVENAGLNGGQALEQIKNKPFGFGFDVSTNEIVDLHEKGIIDPVKVPKEAIKNAVSVAIQLISCGAAITPEPDEKMPNLPK